jgi:hypothetical protein
MHKSLFNVILLDQMPDLNAETYTPSIMGGHARECWPQLLTVELKGM